jgi:hypothetical protein
VLNPLEIGIALGQLLNNQEFHNFVAGMASSLAASQPEKRTSDLRKQLAGLFNGTRPDKNWDLDRAVTRAALEAGQSVLNEWQPEVLPRPLAAVLTNELFPILLQNGRRREADP